LNDNLPAMKMEFAWQIIIKIAIFIFYEYPVKYSGVFNVYRRPHQTDVMYKCVCKEVVPCAAHPTQ
jgi:hypothetical protein